MKLTWYGALGNHEAPAQYPKLLREKNIKSYG